MYLNINKNLKINKTLKFEIGKISDNECIVNLDTYKIKEYWKDNDIYQRSKEVTSYKHNLPWDMDIARLRSLVNIINDGEAIFPIEVFIGHKNGLCFPDGRHRTIVSIINKIPYIKALVKKIEAEKISAVIGYN